MSVQRKLIFFFPIFLLLTAGDYPQEKSLTAQLKEALQKKYASLSILVRNVADFQIERSAPGNNGFSIENFRIKLSGDLDDNFGYSLETKMLNSPAILDADLYYKFSPQFKLDFGLFKLPFSREYLVSEGDIDFVFRSRAVEALNIGKQVGVMLSGGTGNNVLTYAGGIFNGNKGGVKNDNNKFLYVGRIVIQPTGTEKTTVLKIGLNAAQSIDKSVVIMDSVFAGNRLLLGGDLNLILNNFQIYAEIISARLRPVSGSVMRPWGYEVTAGYSPAKNMQVLARWDVFNEEGGLPGDDLAILGFNIVPAELFKFQFNYEIPAGNGKFKNHRLLINGQLYF